MVSIHKICRNCGTPLGNDATWRKQFCTDKCRVQHHRKESNQAHYAHAIQPISKLGKAKTSREKREAIETLKLLRKAIDDQLRLLGDYDTMKKYEMLGDLRDSD